MTMTMVCCCRVGHNARMQCDYCGEARRVYGGVYRCEDDRVVCESCVRRGMVTETEEEDSDNT